MPPPNRRSDEKKNVVVHTCRRPAPAFCRLPRLRQRSGRHQCAECISIDRTASITGHVPEVEPAHERGLFVQPTPRPSSTSSTGRYRRRRIGEPNPAAAQTCRWPGQPGQIRLTGPARPVWRPRKAAHSSSIPTRSDSASDHGGTEKNFSSGRHGGRRAGGQRSRDVHKLHHLDASHQAADGRRQVTCRPDAASRNSPWCPAVHQRSRSPKRQGGAGCTYQRRGAVQAPFKSTCPAPWTPPDGEHCRLSPRGNARPGSARPAPFGVLGHWRCDRRTGPRNASRSLSQERRI